MCIDQAMDEISQGKAKPPKLSMDLIISFGLLFLSPRSQGDLDVPAHHHPFGATDHN